MSVINLISLTQKYESETPFAIAKHSTIGCGGSARAAFYPRTAEETEQLISELQRLQIPYYVVGNMSNVLPADGCSRRVFIVTKQMKRIYETPEKNGLYVEAGASAGALLNECKRVGLSGAEFLEGIPCTLGGALYMNAGVSGAYIGDIVQSITVLREGRILSLSQAECQYSYKKSVFMENQDVLLGVRLCLHKATEKEIFRKREEYSQRRKHLPKGKSMGCVFKNPPNEMAGKLIEGTGLKGFRVGGAVISQQHANFILNDNEAKSAHVKALIKIVKNAVFAQYKIQLEEEIRYLE